MVANFFFCFGCVAKCKNFCRNVLITNLVTNLVTDLVTPKRTNRCGCGGGKWNNRAENITFDKLRLCSGIQLGVFVGVPHTGTKLVGKTNLTKHLGNWGFFGNGSKEAISKLPSP